MRGLPFFKPKNKPQFAGLNFSEGGGGGSSSLPVASADTLGGVKIGEGIDVSSDGTISASGGLTLTNNETVIGTLLGKPLYAKVTHYDNVPAGSFDINVGANCRVKFVYGSGIYDNYFGCLSTMRANSSAYDIQATPTYSSGNCSVNIAIGNSLITDCDILIIYTKTTD